MPHPFLRRTHSANLPSVFFVVKECTVNVQSGNDQPDHKAQHVKFAAANHFKHVADNGKSDNNDTPCDAFLCIFGLVAMLNTVDAPAIS